MVEHLKPADLKPCLDAHAALRREHARILSGTFADAPYKHYKTPEKCGARLRGVEDTMLRDGFGTHLDVLSEWKEDAVKRAEDVGVCERCRDMLRGNEYALRTDSWKRLLQILGIEVEGWQ